MASAWTGKSTPSTQLAAVSLFPVAAERADLAFREKLQRRRMQPGTGFGRVPRPEFVPAAAMADPDEKQVALSDVHVLAAPAGRPFIWPVI
jgi:hypothetical protein